MDRARVPQPGFWQLKKKKEREWRLNGHNGEDPVTARLRIDPDDCSSWIANNGGEQPGMVR